MRIRISGGLAVVAGSIVFISATGCSQTVNPGAPRTMAQPQKLDVVCINVNGANDLPILQPEPVPEDLCSPIPANTSSSAMQYHLFAVVTQRLRGELAVIDVTAATVVDEDRTTPGINFIPVGIQPTDVVVAPDGRLTFVSTAADGMAGIDVIDNRHLLGDWTGTGQYPIGLSDEMGCSLPGLPMALATVPAPASADPSASTYQIVALLAGSGASPATIVTIDPTPFETELTEDGGAVPGAAVPGAFPPCSLVAQWPMTSWTTTGPLTPSSTWPDGVPYADAGDMSDAEPILGPTCPGGVAADAGTDAGASSGQAAQSLAIAASGIVKPPSMVVRNDDVRVAYVADGTLPVIHVIDLTNPANPTELPPLQATRVATLTAPAEVVPVGWLALSPPTRDYKRYLYAIDQSDGSIMVYDVTQPDTTKVDGSMRVPLLRPHAELNPLVPADRIKFSAPAASVVFAQHDWPILSPANGSADTVHEYTGLLCNPNPNAYDVASGAVTDLGAYYRWDQTSIAQAQQVIAPTFPYRLRGVFGFVMLSNGEMVVVDVDDWDAPCRRPDPMSSDPTSGDGGYGVTTGMTGQLDLPEPPPSGPTDLDPYHAPLVYQGAASGTPLPDTTGVTLEAFFPMSAPHRARSSVVLTPNLTGGSLIPTVVGQPQLFDVNGAPLPTSGGGEIGQHNPLILASPLSAGFYDPTYVTNPSEPYPGNRQAPQLPTVTPEALPPPSVRISFDDPTVHQTQDWTVTYEGTLPNTTGISADLILNGPDFSTMTLSAPGAGLCERGIEDWDLGQARAAEYLAELGRLGIPAGASDAGADAGADAGDAGGGPSFALSEIGQWTADYVEITDDLLQVTDPYWAMNSLNPSDDAGLDNGCWNDPGFDDGRLADTDPNALASPHATDRYNYCFATFDAAVNADTHLARDFPILQAFDDYLIVGRFGWGPSTVAQEAGVPEIAETASNRVIVGATADPNSAPFLKQLRCCFHRQAAFKVRTGGEWVTVGSENIGLLHHVVADRNNGGRCVLSCDPQYALMNARAFGVPWPDSSCAAPSNSNGGAAPPPGLDRNSPLAMRNPMFSFVMWAGCPYDHSYDARDNVWRFSVSPGFSPLQVTLGQYATSPASPQAMRFVDSLGQIAVVDGSLQGVVFYDLNTITPASGPYY
ncbi:MAG: hypothetical protein ABTD50_08380 [Polyangiaceae bacterium]